MIVKSIGDFPFLERIYGRRGRMSPLGNKVVTTQDVPVELYLPLRTKRGSKVNATGTVKTANAFSGSFGQQK